MAAASTNGTVTIVSATIITSSMINLTLSFTPDYEGVIGAIHFTISSFGQTSAAAGVVPTLPTPTLWQGLVTTSQLLTPGATLVVDIPGYDTVTHTLQ